MKYICVNLLVLSLLFAAAGRTVSAEEGYTYTVRIYPGNQGNLTGEGIQLAGSSGAKIRPVYEDDGTGNSEIAYMEISGIAFDGEEEAVLYMDPERTVEVTDPAYRVTGVRRAGRDNEDAAATGPVTRDMDYVVAYGTRNENPVEYTVNYQDAAGNTLLPSGVYEGNPGERQYVSARYVEGYLPQAYNMVKTLSEDPAENVFTFIYTQVDTGTDDETDDNEGTVGGTTGTGTAGTGTTGTGTAGGTIGTGAAGGTGTIGGTTGTGAAGGAGTAGAGTTGGTAGAEDAETEADAETGAEDGAGEAAVPDEEVPRDGEPQELIDLDDEDVPLADISSERTGGTVISYLPIYIGIGAAAALALIGVAIYLQKRKKRVLAEELLRKHSDDEKQS